MMYMNNQEVKNDLFSNLVRNLQYYCSLDNYSKNFRVFSSGSVIVSLLTISLHAECDDISNYEFNFIRILQLARN